MIEEKFILSKLLKIFFSSDRRGFKINISNKIENWFPLFFFSFLFYNIPIGILQSEVARRVLRFVLLPCYQLLMHFIRGRM